MDALDVIGDPGLRTTLLHVRGRRRAASIDEVASATGVHHNVARRRLERLAAAGLLTAGFERPPGRTGPGAGRPAKVYSPAPETTAIEFPKRRYPELVGLLVDAVPDRRLPEVGVRFGAYSPPQRASSPSMTRAPVSRGSATRSARSASRRGSGASRTDAPRS